MKLGGNESALPLPLAGEGGVGASPRARRRMDFPPPAALRASTSPASGRGNQRADEPIQPNPTPLLAHHRGSARMIGKADQIAVRAPPLIPLRECRVTHRAYEKTSAAQRCQDL